MTDELIVYAGTRVVGSLRQWHFEYDNAWIEAGWPLSTSLPLRSESFEDPARHWFSNLLPEAGARDRVARRLRLDPLDAFKLLVALGGECAGALTLHPPDQSPRADVDEYQVLDEEMIRALIEEGPSVAFDEETRLSLAGAQDKLAVRFGDRGELCVPVKSAPSTHVIKFPSTDDKALVENERLCLELASRVGLKVPPNSVMELGGGRVLCVERYDRVAGDDHHERRSKTPKRHGRARLSAVERRHQEDFAQALGWPHSRKYEDDGGPSLSAIAANIRRYGLLPSRDLEQLMRWAAFCLAIGNRDNHAKNVSHLLDVETGRWSLAPAYDLVNTTAYKRLKPTLALYIGGEHRVERLNAEHWSVQAKQMGIAPRRLLAVLEETIDTVEHELPRARDTVANELGGSDARLVQFVRAIKKTINSARQSMQ